jgi:hypothetical protein
MGQPLKRPFHNNLEKCTVVNSTNTKSERISVTLSSPGFANHVKGITVFRELFLLWPSSWGFPQTADVVGRVDVRLPNIFYVAPPTHPRGRGVELIVCGTSAYPARPYTAPSKKGSSPAPLQGILGREIWRVRTFRQEVN